MQKPSESRLIWEFFGSSLKGMFVDIGANHPFDGNQTWFLEQHGWTGLLIEPNPELAQLLREQRPKSKTLQVAVGAPSQVGVVDFHLAVNNGKSSLIPSYDTVVTRKIQVQLKTLDSILKENEISQIDFLSLDVEKFELEVLEGFDLAKWKPRLILIEDFWYNYQKHRYLKMRGYQIGASNGL
jgi:FkbM family methyltransferase